jgi:hypothetical protein
MSSGYQSDEDLLAESVEAERSRSFEGKDRGEWIASGRMDEDDYALTAKEMEEGEEKIRKRWAEERKTPEEKAEEQLKKVLEQNRRIYINTGCEDNYTPSPEDRIEREAELESIRNPQMVPF